ncbi:hypothetical protein [Neptunicella marina]|uniref:Right-handed parallel beta-helix repeat-containing protein n=1 Tax=Neptunicella marina TaxID=2125989 RepID=A0A8J6IU06_9ALTE|nr:hypothetical protein [Neptunicella marina]MBC3765777.1 hypothetical protein [Neptunicella marina]
MVGFRHLLYMIGITLVIPTWCMAQDVYLNGKKVKDLAAAMKSAKDFSVIRLSEGLFEQTGVLKANNVLITGEPNKTAIANKTSWGKGALVIVGNNTSINNIECFGISVASKNGACVRLDGKNLELNNVYFHDAEQGLLTGQAPGFVSINNSKFERLGKAGQAHGIYVGGGELLINNSQFLSSKDEGHEIKSRAQTTTILNSTIANLTGKDSRLIDVSNGGVLEIKDSVLQQSNATSNSDVIGFGLEGLSATKNKISLIGNIFLLDREHGSVPLHIAANDVPTIIEQNIFVGKVNASQISENFYFNDREAANLPPYPALPSLK